jgi:hypothetical protein
VPQKAQDDEVVSNEWSKRINSLKILRRTTVPEVEKEQKLDFKDL